MYPVNRRKFMARGLVALGAGALASAAPGLSYADIDYPKSPIRLIVPRSAGGVLDIIGRDWVNSAAPNLGAIAVENFGGGGGMTGTAMVAHATADGYTLLLGSTSDLVLNPALSAEQLYDPVKDFSSVAGLAISVAMIMVNPSVPAKNLKELVAYAKANPGKLSYGSAGAGTMSNLCGELFKKLAGLPDIVHIPARRPAIPISSPAPFRSCPPISPALCSKCTRPARCASLRWRQIIACQRHLISRRRRKPVTPI